LAKRLGIRSASHTQLNLFELLVKATELTACVFYGGGEPRRSVGQQAPELQQLAELDLRQFADRPREQCSNVSKL
jgi:hypothetical protein